MAFEKVTQYDRVSQYPNRRTLTDENQNTSTYTVAMAEGNVSKEGTEWGATYANDLESRIDNETAALEGNMGVVEASSTSATAYSVGQCLVYNGQLYKVTASIAVGDTLTVGTNIATTSISEINSNLGGTKISVNSDGAYITYTPTGGADPVSKKLGEYTLQDVGWIGYGYAATIDIAMVLPNIYKKLTTSNFVAISFRLGSDNKLAVGPNWISGMIPTLSYNSTTGILTISNYASGNSGGSISGTYGLGLHMAAIYV